MGDDAPTDPEILALRAAAAQAAAEAAEARAAAALAVFAAVVVAVVVAATAPRSRADTYDAILKSQAMLDCGVSKSSRAWLDTTDSDGQRRV